MSPVEQELLTLPEHLRASNGSIMLLVEQELLSLPEHLRASTVL